MSSPSITKSKLALFGALSLILTGTVVFVFGYRNGYRLEYREGPGSDGASNGDNVIDLVHDVGLMRPNERKTARFEVFNSTSTCWTVDRVETGCGCTVPSISAQRILPGKTETVSVVFTAGSRTVDTHKSVFVRFKEKDAPYVRLTVKARIREPIVVDVPNIRIEVAEADRSIVRRQVRVLNYSESAWADLAVLALPEWLSIGDPVLVAETKDADRFPGVRPVQTWQFSIHTCGDAFDAGLHRTTLQIVPDNKSELAKQLPVTITCDAAVRVTPNQLFFGTVARGSSATRRVLLRFPTGHGPASLESIGLSIPDIDELSVSLRKISPTVWELTAEFSPTSKSKGFVSGNIVLDMKDASLSLIRIPIYAES